MTPAVREKLPALIAPCSGRGVKSLSILGSAVGGGFDPARSDIDVLVEFEPMTVTQHADGYLSLLEDAEALFGRPVDLVSPRRCAIRTFESGSMPRARSSMVPEAARAHLHDVAEACRPIKSFVGGLRDATKFTEVR